MNVTIGGIARTVEITSFDKLGDVKVCMLTTTADGSVGFQQLNQEVIDTIYASFPVDTANGDIASFEDGADNVPVRELKLNLEPYQNLNGYGSPWVGGAGKNKLPTPIKGTYSSNGLTLTVDDKGAIAVSGTTTSSGTLLVPLSQSYVIPSSVMQGGTGCMYIFNSFTTGQNNAFVMYYDDTRVEAWQFTVANRKADNWVGQAGQTINKIGVQYTSGQTYNGKFAPMFSEDGTTDATSFIPYSNICPIYPSNGKNLYNSATKEDGYISATGVVTVDGSSVHSALIPVTPNQPIVFSGKTIGSASSSNKRLHGYNSSGTWVQQLGHAYVNDGDRYTISATVPSGITGVKISFRGTDEQVQVEYGKAPSAYVPYNAIGITRTGKNLLSADKIHRGIIGDKTFTIENLTSTVYRSAIIKLSAGYWTFTFPVNINLVRLVKDGTHSVITIPNISTYTINTTTDDWVGISWRDATSSSTNWDDSSVTQLEKGSASTGIEPYSTERYYPISDNPVYGGTLDVTTGVLTVTKGYIVSDGTDAWAIAPNDQNAYFYRTMQSAGMPSTNYPYIQTNEFKTISQPNERANAGTVWGIYGQLHVNVPSTIAPSGLTQQGITEFKTWLSSHNMQVVYELATPQTYQLTPVQVNALLGYNNIWTDSGTVEVQYRANIGLYIQKIIGSSEDDMIANQNIAANQYFFVGEELYYSTSAISAGQTIIVGTNCIKTNLADALNALNS